MNNKVEKFIVEYFAKNINRLFGNKKTSFMGVSILAAMPVKVKVIERDVKVGRDLMEFIQNNLMAYVKHGSSDVHFDLTYPKGTDVIKEITPFMQSILYVHIHEILHVLYLDNTTQSKEVFNKISEDHRLVNIAQDYRINLVVSDLFTDAKFPTPELNEIAMYDTKYRNQTAQEILYSLLEDNMEAESNGDGTETITINGDMVRKIIEELEASSDGSSTEGQLSEAQVDPQALQQALAKIISQRAGSDSQAILGEEILRVSTDSSWFKSLHKKLSNKLFLSTSGSRSTWSSKNMIYGGLFKAPANFSRKKTIAKLIVFVDQSGSVDDESLGRLVDIIHTNKKRIDEIEFHVFDTAIVSSLVTDDKAKMMQFVSVRQACGGTDMACCWDYLEKLKPKEQKDSIVIMVSDNYCDHTPRPIHKKMHTYFVHAINSKDVEGIYPNSTMIYMKDK